MSDNARRPNIIILILDAVRAKNVSCYGYRVRTTPHLDAFAADSVLFEHAFSPATWTIPTHASLLSGLYLAQHRIESIRADRRFAKAIVTLPQALRSHGYRTAAFSQNVLFSPNHHLGGFDQFYDLDTLLDSRLLTSFVQRVSDRSSGSCHRVARYVRKMIAPRLLLDVMYDWIITRDEKEPFFLMANVANAHYPWAPPPDILLQIRLNPRYLLKQDFVTLDPFAFDAGKRQVTEVHRRIWRSLYDAAIMHLDREVGRFLRRLHRWSGWQNTIIVISADHGEMLGDYRDLVGHMLTLHDNLIHVPLIVRHPAYPPGLKVEGVVQTLDVYPSALEWAGVPADRVPPAQLQRPTFSTSVAVANDSSGFAFAEEDYTDSYDVLGALLGVNPAMDPKRYPRQQIAVRSANHKYIWCDDRPGKLYNLVTDPGEEHNLINSGAATDRVVLRELQHALEAWRCGLELFPPQSVDEMVEVDPEVMKRLRGLGYVA